MENIEQYYDMAVQMILQYAPKFLLALIVLVIGLQLIKWVINGMRRGLKGREVDETLGQFLANLIGWILRIVLFISVFAILGGETASLVAVVGAAGLAIGLALQGSLANFAGGVLILLFKPFKVGDKIETMDRTGDVKDIQILNTIITTADNKTVILPNGAVMNGDIVNYTMQGLIRVDLTIGVSYDSDIKKAKQVLLEVMRNHPLVLETPEPFVGVAELADSAVNLAVRPHCKPENYWDVFFDVLESGKNALDQAGISIPFPQLDIHMEQ